MQLASTARDRPAPAATPERQFDAAVRGDASQPFVTYYDEASGERTELSVRSLANWVAKTHYLLLDELGLGVGDAALVALPPHWISVPILLGCLSAGLALTDADPAAEVAFVTPASAAVADGVPDVFAVAPEGAATGFGAAGSDIPSGTADYVSAVRPQPDAWAAVAMPAGPNDPCLPGLSRGEVMGLLAVDDLPAGARVLTTADWATPHDWVLTVLAPLAAGGSIVIVRNAPDDGVVQRRMGQERATIRR